MMIVEQQITTAKEIEVQFTEITLLSKEEYLANKDLISLRSWWWLRSPYPETSSYAGFVYDDGYISYDPTGSEDVYVRPALRYDLKSCNLRPGDKVEIAGYLWTVLRGGLILCDEIAGSVPFRKDYKAEDANIYETSDVKKYIEEWAKKQGIVFER